MPKQSTKNNDNNKRTKTCFIQCIDTIAWFVGWVEGLIVGICVGCYEAEENIGLAEKLQDGCATGFTEGEWIGNIDHKPKKNKNPIKNVGKCVRFAK